MSKNEIKDRMGYSRIVGKIENEIHAKTSQQVEERVVKFTSRRIFYPLYIFLDNIKLTIQDSL